MKKMLLDKIPDDWPVMWLREHEAVRLNPDGSNSVHRIQTIRAMKGDFEYEEKHDLGEAARYQHEPLYMLSGGFTNAGRIREYADQVRQQKTLAVEAGLPVPDIPKLYEQYVHEAWAKRNHISVIGPAFTRQRS